MIRLRFVLVAFALGFLGIPLEAEAADPPSALVSSLGSVSDASMSWLLLFGQSALMDELRGDGFYLNLFKFIPVILIYLAWVKIVDWVNEDTKDLENKRFALWNSIVFGGGVAGLILVLIVPVYIAGILLLLLGLLAPTLIYVNVRNQTVDDQLKVLTPYHFGEVINGMFGKKIFNKEAEEFQRNEIPISFVFRAEEGKIDVDQYQAVQDSDEFYSAKELVYDAISRRTTDVLMEPVKQEIAVRYRIDGMMNAAEPFERADGDLVIGIYKLLSGLDPKERRKPQDGVFATKMEGREIDFRVHTSGTKAGEKLMMRILDKAAQVNKIDELGMRPKMVERLRELTEQTEGMIVCCSPPSGGKTSTLYACLREIDRFQRNIITVEDPVEYTIENVNQTEVNTKAGQVFSQSLRSVLRQDPDVMVAGTLPDKESGEILAQAATSGHLTFTSLNANESVAAIARLLELGLEQSIISSALTAVVNQRLVRLLCEACKEPYKPKDEFLKKANLPKDKIDVFYRPPKDPEEVCPVCGGTGYIGRTGIFELLEINEPIRDLIRDNPSPKAIKNEARKNGMIYLTEDGLRQVIQGRTSVEELMRVMK